MFILKELWTKEVEEPEVKNSYQYVFEIREKLEDTLKLAHTELQKAQNKGKHYYDRKTKIRKFVPGDEVLDFAALAAPLSDLTRKGQPNKVEWGEAQQKAYQSIKALLTKEPVLRLPDRGKTYFLQTDASDSGIGAVLMQKHEGKLFPVCYASKKLSRAERNYSTIERECLAIVWGLKRFHLYLYGVPFLFYKQITSH